MTTTPPRLLGIELDLDGAHPAAWRRSRHDPADLLGGQRTRETALAAETAGFHLATFADGPVVEGQDVLARADAVQRAATAAPVTRRIALAPQVDVLYTEPFHVATQLATLDYVSGGRAGWVVTAADTEAEARAVGREQVVDPAAVAAEAADVVEVNRRLWDSWEDDAVVRDVATGRYLDADKLHYADFEGETFSVKGTSIIPRPLQGQLPVLAPAELVDPATVEAVLVTASTTTGLVEAAVQARSAGAGAVVVDLEVALDVRGESGPRRVAALDAHTPWEPRTARYAGDAPGLVSVLSGLFAVADLVRLLPAVLDEDLPELHFAVLPALREAGLLAPQEPGTTFRSALGLARPASRYTAS